MTSYTTFDSPVGELLLVGEETRDDVTLTSLSMPGQRNAPVIQPDWQNAPGAFGHVIRQLEAYFAGE
ncbi:MAG TPA: cysteine methyltransferase, partial [Streptosporangiaceae bacterium]|nr:cysteine methyltransferase [Streptosporangiaceae bacterium]